MCPRIACPRRGIVTLQCIGCICLTFLQCALSNVSSNCLPGRMQSHIGCICLTFLHCAFSNVSSNGLPEKRQSRIGCICLTFLQCALSNVSSNCLPGRMQGHIGCICLTFLQCAFSNVPSNCLPGRMQSHIGYISVKGKGIVTLPMSLVALCVFKRILKMFARERMHKTNSQVMDIMLCRSVTKNLTPYRFNFFGWGLDGQITEIHSFPTMYIIGGLSLIHISEPTRPY